jgi:hypothetical protein
MILGDHRQKNKKKRKKTNSPGWIGTSTRVIAPLNKHRLVGLGHQHGQPLLTSTAEKTRDVVDGAKMCSSSPQAYG